MIDSSFFHTPLRLWCCDARTLPEQTKLKKHCCAGYPCHPLRFETLGIWKLRAVDFKEQLGWILHVTADVDISEARKRTAVISFNACIE